MAKPEEIGSVVAFLAGDGASYMTATTVFADGGIMQSSPGPVATGPSRRRDRQDCGCRASLRRGGGSAMGEATRNRVEGLRGVRYGEILLLRSDGAGYRGDVWNTMGFNDCPPEAFAELDAAAIAAEHGALLAVKNGPRHWVLDAIEAEIRASAPTAKFGALEMFLAATIDFGPTLPDPGGYVERHVARDTVFEWSARTPLHELRAPDGRVYVMQALSHAVDASQTVATLSTLEHGA